MNETLEVPAQLELGRPWRQGYAALGPAFFTEVAPTALPAPYGVSINRTLARELGLDATQLASPEGVEAFTGNRLPAGSRPLATVYSGHQFGVWAGQLGDGRAILLGELDTPVGPREVQLKGCGRTPYSRMGDGRAVLRSSIREYLASEAMHGLGIPTTRALCLTGSDAPVRREEIETAAVLTRVAPSFVRFGHFEHFFAREQYEGLRQLADDVIERWFAPCQAGGSAGNAYAALLAAVSARTAAMVAQWQAVGFCHGVMNTDNMSILGLTIDYGPFQFLDAFDPGHICNHSDIEGRYAYNRQPHVAYWNLVCLGQALMPLIGEQASALAALETYRTAFPRELMARMRAKLGLAQAQEGDPALIEDVLRLLAAERVDYTIFWRRLSRHAAGDALQPVRDLFLDREGIDAWLARWRQRLNQEDAADAGARMLASNPKYVLRNHLLEQAIQRARRKDFSEVNTLLALAQSPFDEHPALHASHAGFPPDWASSIEISCSS